MDIAELLVHVPPLLMLVLAYPLGGPAALLIVLFLLFDSYVMDKADVLGAFSLDTATIAAILGGYVFGPVIGFLTAFIAARVIKASTVAHPQHTRFAAAYIPTTKNVVNGVAAIASGLLAFLPLLIVAPIAVVLRFITVIIIWLGGDREIWTVTFPFNLIIAIIFNTILAFFIGGLLGLPLI